MSTRVSRERELRQRLRIPDDAERVLIFGETSHWDPNWLQSAEEYYQRHIKGALDKVVAELDAEPRRVFSVECVFFFRLYWQREPAQRPILRRLVESGQLRFTGSGLTTPDTLLPDSEAILRDYLLGQRWLWDQELPAEPKLAYLPDDFGHSPGLPSLLEALGYTQACVTRIDGMYFVGCDYRLPSAYPLRGSSAALLSEELGTLDFVWRAPDGAEVLCHWNAFTYFQGDMLAHRGIMRWMDTMAISWRTERYVAKQIERFAGQLEPLALTPYLFCPIGCDFNGPITDLVALLERYNARRYPDTGLYVVNAAMEDYLDLVNCHRFRLPTLDLDPNPYWMGFYASRPQVKRLCRDLTHKLVLAEQLAAPRDDLRARALESFIDAAWDVIAVSNHHDFITGTSPDRIYQGEQLPWLAEATRTADEALASLRPAPKVEAEPSAPPRPPAWSQQGGKLVIETSQLRLVLDEERGGCITSLEAQGREWSDGLGNDLWVYRDSGGLWRMGQEFLGGTFRPIAKASDQPAALEIVEHAAELEVRITCTLADQHYRRTLWLREDGATIWGQVRGIAPRESTVTCRFPSTLSAREVSMDVPGGALSRPLEKLYQPTYWAARSYAALRDDNDQRALAVLLSGPAAVSAAPSGSSPSARKSSGLLEWIVLRNANRERAFRVVPILAHPASGTDDERHSYDYALQIGLDQCALESLPSRARAIALERWLGEHEGTTSQLPVVLSGPEAWRAQVVALKRAERGSGLVLRIERMGVDATPLPLKVSWRGGRINRAWANDARERDLGEFEVQDGEVALTLTRTLTTVRLQLQ